MAFCFCFFPLSSNISVEKGWRWVAELGWWLGEWWLLVARSVVSWRKWDFGFSFGVFFMAGGWSFWIIGLGFFFFFCIAWVSFGRVFLCVWFFSITNSLPSFLCVYNHIIIGKSFFFFPLIARSPSNLNFFLVPHFHFWSFVHLYFDFSYFFCIFFKRATSTSTQEAC